MKENARRFWYGRPPLWCCWQTPACSHSAWCTWAIGPWFIPSALSLDLSSCECVLQPQGSRHASARTPSSITAPIILLLALWMYSERLATIHLVHYEVRMRCIISKLCDWIKPDKKKKNVSPKCAVNGTLHCVLYTSGEATDAPFIFQIDAWNNVINNNYLITLYLFS